VRNQKQPPLKPLACLRCGKLIEFSILIDFVILIELIDIDWLHLTWWKNLKHPPQTPSLLMVLGSWLNFSYWLTWLILIELIDFEHIDWILHIDWLVSSWLILAYWLTLFLTWWKFLYHPYLSFFFTDIILIELLILIERGVIDWSCKVDWHAVFDLVDKKNFFLRTIYFYSVLILPCWFLLHEDIFSPREKKFFFFWSSTL